MKKINFDQEKHNFKSFSHCTMCYQIWKEEYPEKYSEYLEKARKRAKKYHEKHRQSLIKEVDNLQKNKNNQEEIRGGIYYIKVKDWYYIGQTSSFRSRIFEHRRNFSSVIANQPVNDSLWFKKINFLKRKNYQITEYDFSFDILEECADLESTILRAKEMSYIFKFQLLGLKVLNLLDFALNNNFLPFPLTTEQKKKLKKELFPALSGLQKLKKK